MRFPQDPQLPQGLDIATASADTGTASMAGAAVLTTTLCCIECSQAWTADDERWRMKLLEEPGEEPELVPYCPACHLREFGV